MKLQKSSAVSTLLAVFWVIASNHPLAGPIVIEAFTDQAAFEARLGGTVNTVDFDAIDTTTDPAAFAADLFKPTSGIVITGEGGQFASKDFGFGAEFIPVSGDNMYAPGPTAGKFDVFGAGGNQTTVTFFDAGMSALTAGFGVYFIDADFHFLVRVQVSLKCSTLLVLNLARQGQCPGPTHPSYLLALWRLT